MNKNVALESSLRSDAFILTDEQIKALCKKVKLGHTLAAIAQSFGINRATLVKIIKRDSKVAKAYGEAREAYFKPALEWYESLFDKKNIKHADPNLLMRAFEFKMKSRAAWGIDPNLDSLGEDDQSTIDRLQEDPIVAKARARILEKNAEDMKREIEELRKIEALKLKENV
jgi:predicted DNA-binding protein YlxM (UPF0122 family)